VKTEDGGHEVINVPSDGAERAVGNAVLLTKKPPEETAGVGGADGVMMWIALGLVAVALAAVVVAAVVLKKPGKNA